MDNEAFERMEAFINGEMDVDARLEFEKELSQDLVLQERFEIYKRVQDTLPQSVQNRKQEEKLKQTLSLAYNEHIGKPATMAPVRNLRKWYYSAAAVLLIAVFIIFIPKNKSSSSRALYAEYAVFPALSNTRGSGDTLLTSALNSYNAKHFKKAAEGFGQVLIKDTGNIEVQMNLYLSYLQNNDLREALQGFIRLAGFENVYRSQAQWYSALVYLRLNNIDACKKMLLKIPRDADTYTRARQLLSDLR